MILRVLQKNSGSIAVNVPPKFLRNLNVKIGDYVELELTVDRKIVITKHLPPQGTTQP